MAYVVTRIVDQTSQLQVEINSANYVTIPKSAIKLRLDGNVVWLTDSSQSALTVNGGSPQIYRLTYSSITAPATASASALLIAILAMLNTGGSITGYATANNQVLEIAAIGTTNTRLQSLIDESTNGSGIPSVWKNPGTDVSWASQISGQISNIAVDIGNITNAVGALNRSRASAYQHVEIITASATIAGWIANVEAKLNAIGTNVVGNIFTNWNPSTSLYEGYIQYSTQ